MITTYLEKLIHSGLAKYNTFVFGTGGVGQIPVEPGSSIVITDFIYFNFCDVDGQINDSTEWFRRSVHQVDFYSEKSRNSYVFRSNVDGILISPGNSDLPYSNGHVKVDCYLVHDSDVHINVNTILPPNVWTIDFGLLPGKVNETENPLGYQNLNAVRKVDFGNNEEYIPYGLNRGTAAGIGGRGQMRVNVDLGSILKTPNVNDVRSAMIYPIINIGYVQINKSLGKIAQGTK